MTLDEFENQLESTIGRPTSLRPFVCDGSPLDCKVFIAGLNPASAMGDSFWDYWISGQGFDKERWFEAYKKARRERPLKPGRKRRNEVSNTRRVIQWIVEALSPIKVLETNIYSAASEEYADLTGADRDTAAFNFLIAAIKPAVIVAHGKDAVELIDRLPIEVAIIKADHFSRGWSQARAENLAEQIRNLM